MSTPALPGWPGEEEPFHAGERELQTRTGLRERMAGIGRKVIRDFMPEQHRELFGKLPMIVVGSQDAGGRPWASLLTGTPGFVSTPDERLMRIDALPHADDPLAQQLVPGAPLGLLGIELETRRRNRMNGRISVLDRSGFAVQVEQSFGNCPQYIQARSPFLVPHTPADVTSRRESGTLSERAQALIAAADTFFIASAAEGGVDVSHRGGRPGFVHVESDGARTVLTAPDYRGNFFFNTLGNIVRDPHAGLLFVDFDRGDLLMLTGAASIIWDGPEVDAHAGAQRLLRVEAAEGVWLEGALAWEWSEAELAPQLEPLGQQRTSPP